MGQVNVTRFAQPGANFHTHRKQFSILPTHAEHIVDVCDR
jgi:hypothetical protein